jgi:hypothetical protein
LHEYSGIFYSETGAEHEQTAFYHPVDYLSGYLDTARAGVDTEKPILRRKDPKDTCGRARLVCRQQTRGLVDHCVQSDIPFDSSAYTVFVRYHFSQLVGTYGRLCGSTGRQFSDNPYLHEGAVTISSLLGVF